MTPDFNYSDGRSYYVYLLLKYLDRKGHRVFLCTNGGDSTERVKGLGIKIFENRSLNKKVSFVNSVKYLSEITDKHEIDIIHSHHRYSELIANTALKSCRRKSRSVFTALSLVDKRYAIEYRSDKIIAVSSCVKDMLINRFKVNEDRISLIPNFTDSEELSPEQHVFKKTKKDKDKIEINILSVGRFHKEKDHLTLLKAIYKLKDKKINLILVGEGEEKDSYIKYISNNSLNVKLVHPQRDLKKFFENSDICVLSSVRDPFPGFMLQSGLYRKPFIGSDVDGIAELIHDGKNGLLFKKQNYAELAGKIKLFTENKILAENCAEELHRNVMKNYTEKKVIPEIEKLYNSL